MGMDKTLKKSLVEYITGRMPELTLEGHPTTLAVLYDAVQSSRHLFLALEEGNVSSVETALAKKRVAVQRWEKVTGRAWDI